MDDFVDLQDFGGRFKTGTFHQHSALEHQTQTVLLTKKWESNDMAA